MQLRSMYSRPRFGLDVEYVEVYSSNYEVVSGSYGEIATNGSIAPPYGAFDPVGPGASGIIVYFYRNFPNNAQVCGAITSLPGYPCETIHK
jgi:hypothetical protein